MGGEHVVAGERYAAVVAPGASPPLDEPCGLSSVRPPPRQDELDMPAAVDEQHVALEVALDRAPEFGQAFRDRVLQGTAT